MSLSDENRALSERLEATQGALKQAVKMTKASDFKSDTAKPAKQVLIDQTLTSTFTACPHCGSDNFRKDGTIKETGKQRFKCKDCGKRFS